MGLISLNLIFHWMDPLPGGYVPTTPDDGVIVEVRVQIEHFSVT